MWFLVQKFQPYESGINLEFERETNTILMMWDTNLVFQ